MVEPNMEAAGIEPASESLRNAAISSDFSYKTEIAGYTVLVTDSQLYIYEPGAEGSSELISDNLLERLRAVSRAATYSPRR